MYVHNLDYLCHSLLQQQIEIVLNFKSVRTQHHSRFFFIVEHFGSVYIGTNYQIWEHNFRKELNCQNFCDVRKLCILHL